MSDRLEELFALAIEQSPDEAEKTEVAQVKEGSDVQELPKELLGEDKDRAALNIAAMIRDLNLGGKIKLALLGNQTARALLIRDHNRLIPQFVLENPRLTENEVHEFARNKDLDENILRAIAGNSGWMKNYAIKLALVSNPKTPVDVTLKWAKFLKDKDLRLLSKSRNVPQALATQCRKLVEQREKK